MLDGPISAKAGRIGLNDLYRSTLEADSNQPFLKWVPMQKGTARTSARYLQSRRNEHVAETAIRDLEQPASGNNREAEANHL